MPLHAVMVCFNKQTTQRCGIYYPEDFKRCSNKVENSYAVHLKNGMVVS